MNLLVFYFITYLFYSISMDVKKYGRSTLMSVFLFFEATCVAAKKKFLSDNLSGACRQNTDILSDLS